MRLMRAFTMCAAAGAAAIALSFVDHDACDIYPDCRPLTEGEMGLARAIFGESILYQDVSIINGRYLGIFPIGFQYLAIAPDGNIYVVNDAMSSSDYSLELLKKPFFLHEMMHVWQKYKGVNVLVTAFRLHTDGAENPYRYELADDTQFADLSIEQQAVLLHEYVMFNDQVRTQWHPITDVASLCEKFSHHKTILEQALTVPTMPAACAVYAP